MFLGEDMEGLRHKKVTSTYPSSTCHITQCLHERSRNKHIRKGKFQRFLHAKRHTAPSILKEGNTQHNRGLTRVKASVSTVTAVDAWIHHISCIHCVYQRCIATQTPCIGTNLMKSWCHCREGAATGCGGGIWRGKHVRTREMTPALCLYP